MARVDKRVGKRGTTYRITVYKGYLNGKQQKETCTYTLEEMGISALSDRGNPRAESTIMKEVQLYADNLEKRLSGASYMKGDKITFSAFYENTWKPYAEDHFSASSYYTYTKHIESIFIPEIGSLKIGKISAERLSAIYRNLAKEGRMDGKNGGYSKRSIITFHKHLQSVMRLATKFKIIEDNPCKYVEFPTQSNPDKIKYLTQEQTEIFLNLLENPSPCVVNEIIHGTERKMTVVYDFCAREVSRLQYNTFKVLFRVALFSGCRIGELLALTWNDIDFDTNTLYINKAVAYAKSMGGTYVKAPKTTSSNREVVIPQNEIQLLRQLHKEQMQTIMKLGTAWEGVIDRTRLDDNFVFPQHTGKVMWKCAPNRFLTRLVKNYNAQAPEEKKLPPITVHCLRHTSATLLIAGDMDIKTVSARLGHKRIQTTLDIYAHALKKRDEQASAVLDNMFNTKSAKSS